MSFLRFQVSFLGFVGLFLLLNVFQTESRPVALSSQLSLNGTDTTYDGVARSVVQIIANDRTICSGIIVDSYTVVSAKHCFKDEREYSVVYGTVKTFNYPERHLFLIRPIKYIARHDSLDVAVLTLTDPLEDAVPVKFNEDHNLKCGSTVHFYGFGFIDSIRTMPNVLQTMTTVVQNSCTNNSPLPIDPETQKDHLWTRAAGRTACNADSGGLVTNDAGEMVGIIVSKDAPKGCVLGDYNYAVKLSSVINFIIDHCEYC